MHAYPDTVKMDQLEEDSTHEQITEIETIAQQQKKVSCSPK